MDAMNVETAKFILNNIDKSNKRLSDLNSLISEYQFQIENVGKTSSLGQEFMRNLATLKGERNTLTYQLEQLKQHIKDFDIETLRENKQTEEKKKLKEENNLKKKDSSLKEEVKVNQKYDYYKISSVAAFKDNKIIDAIILDDEKQLASKISQLYYEYGNDISIKLNRDGYIKGKEQPVSENIGWINLDEYKFPTNNSSTVEKQAKKVVETKKEEEKSKDDYVEEYKFDEIADSYQEGSIYNFKVVYKKGKYRIDFDIVEEGDIYHQTYENKISIKYLYSKYIKRELAKKYNIAVESKIYKNLDVNLVSALNEIDKEYGTDYVTDYVNGQLNVKLRYDLRDIFSNRDLKLKDKLIQRKVALGQKKITSATIEGANYPGVLVGALSALVLLTTLGISSILPSFGKKTSNKQLASTKTNTVRELTTEILDDITTEKVTEQTTTEEKIKKENRGLGLDDSLLLVHKDSENNIKYTFKLSEDLNNKGNKLLASDYSECDRFKISAIAVCKNQEKIAEINITNNSDNLHTNDLYDKYGKDVDIEFNFDAYKEGEDTPAYKNIGWLSLNDFKTKNYVENIEEAKKEIEKENKANIIVEELANDNTNENNKDSNEEIDYCNFGLNGKIALFYKDTDGNLTFSQKLTGDAWGNGNEIEAGKIGCDYFKISYIAVYDGNTVLDVKNVKDGENVDEITSAMYQEYGKDISVSYNFNGYMNDDADLVYKNVGWIDINKIVDVKEKIQNIKESSSTTKSYIKK